MSQSDSGERISPIGQLVSAAAAERAAQSPEYRAAREEYAAIRRLREQSGLAARIRERRYELDLSAAQVADRAGTPDSVIARIEAGEHTPDIPALRPILAVLDKQLLVGLDPASAGAEPGWQIPAPPEIPGG